MFFITTGFLFEENGIKAESKVKNDIFVKADEIRLKEVFNNIVSNTAKCMPDRKNTDNKRR